MNVNWLRVITWSRLLATLFLLLNIGIHRLYAADQSAIGIYEDRILLGQTAVLTGPTAALGQGMRDGMIAAFEEINRKGGVHGRKLELKTYDDGYEPERAIQNTKQLVENDKVFALVGGVGTPTANAIIPIITEAKVPFIGAYTGAELLRYPHNRYVVNIRASYHQETEQLVDYLTRRRGVKKIGVFYQDDSYGMSGLDGVNKALEKRKLTPAISASYKRNSLAVKNALLTMLAHKPEAIIMVGAYAPCAEFVRLAKAEGLQALIASISFVGSEAYAQEAGQSGIGTIISQVVPLPWEDYEDLVKQYRTALRAYRADLSYGFISLEGYSVGHFLIQVLDDLGKNVDRSAFIDRIYQRRHWKLDTMPLSFETEDNQGSDRVWLTELLANQHFRVLSVNKNASGAVAPQKAAR
jgi:branched-chain amino acid transport system substrate-binding protein